MNHPCGAAHGACIELGPSHRFLYAGMFIPIDKNPSLEAVSMRLHGIHWKGRALFVQTVTRP
jgi:hypothetical protein